MNKIFKLFAAFIICSGIFISTVSAESKPEDVQAFREALMNTAKEDTRVFREDIYFVVPTIQSELAFIGRTKENKFDAAGSFIFWATDDAGNTTDLEIPFYATQIDKDMKIYFQVDKEWKKFQAPSLAAFVTDMLATPTKAECEEFIADVKEVVVLQENDKKRIMLVKLDGNKIADDMKLASEKNPADNGTANDKTDQDDFLNYLDAGLRNSEIWYTWTVDKTNWQTVTLSLNLSNLVQATAQAILNDPTAEWGEFGKGILEIVGYYSETKAFTTYLNEAAAAKLEIPKKALKAKDVDDMVPTMKK